MQKNAIKIFSPATIANVSCGFDVIGMALERPVDEIILRKSYHSGIRILNIHGAILSTRPDKNVVGVVLYTMLNKFTNIKYGLEVEIFKNIQPGSGIGSSAASAAGAAVGANLLLGDRFTTTELVQIAMEGERFASGIAHADNVAPAIMGGFTLVRSYHPLDIIELHVPQNLWATVLHPHIEIKTSEAREILKKKVLMSDAIKQWGNVGALIAGLYQENYELISRSMEDVIVEPVRSILIPSFYKLKMECKKAGALGGSISGSGPSVFMLSCGKAKAQDVAKCMDDIYAKLGIDYTIYVSPINSQGVQWEWIT
ncbi:MAG: homoserine kinase [Candidatus Walczuchella monophlebidarum]